MAWNATTWAAYVEARDLGSPVAIAFRDQIIAENMKLVQKLAHKYRREIPIEDAIQTVVLAVIRALETYKPGRARFSTYAALWARKYLFDDMAKTGFFSRRPPTTLMPHPVKTEILRFYARMGRVPTAEDLGIDPVRFEEWAYGAETALARYLVDVSEASESAVEGYETRSSVRATLAVLDPADAALLTRVDCDGEDLAIAARALRIPVREAPGRLEAARKAFRDEWLSESEAASGGG